MSTNGEGLMDAPARIRAVIADDHCLFMEGMKRLISMHCDIVGTVTNGRDVVSLACETGPELVFLDIAMPLLNGIEAARQIRKRNPAAKIIFVTMHFNRDYVREAFEAGASGYVMKHAAVSDLSAAIREVQQGRYYLSPMISERFLGRTLEPNESPSKLFSALSPRQREVLQLVAEGKSAKEIAALLFISVKTVEFHKKHLMDELNLRNSAELVRYAVENGWVAS
ncbi:MAG: response regulator transcription factor [Acidobacteriaceae bacterium]|nr:response regulator transcription factor [Acidobacteriaceae bacterium]MBV9441972.1 response regulator transcription factor [Acidobacteriaceae bacterium]